MSRPEVEKSWLLLDRLEANGWRVVCVTVNFVNFVSKLASAAGLAYLGATKEKVGP